MTFINFMIMTIERLAGINFVIAVAETYFFTSSFILQIVNILVFLFRNLCVLDKLWHCFFNIKEHLKLINNYNHCCWCQCYYKWHFYHYFHTVHYCRINWNTSTYTHCIFTFPIDCKSSYRKNKIIPIDLSPLRTKAHAHNCCQL